MGIPIFSIHSMSDSGIGIWFPKTITDPTNKTKKLKTNNSIIKIIFPVPDDISAFPSACH